MNKCDVNFSKLNKRNVKVFVGETANKKVEIIGQKGKYSIWTDESTKTLANLKGKTGTLKEVKSAVSDALCLPASEAKTSSTKKKDYYKMAKTTPKPAA